MKQDSLFGFDATKADAKFKESMTVANDLRASAFLPYSRFRKSSQLMREFAENNNILIRETPWGKIEVRNRLLNQKHFLVFLALMGNKQSVEYPEDEPNKVKIFFSITSIAEMLGQSKSGKSNNEIIETIKEIADVVVYREDEDGQIDSNGGVRIIENFRAIKDGYRKGQPKFVVYINRTFYRRIIEKVSISFPERLKEIKGISGRNSAAVQAIILHFISQKASLDEPQRKTVDLIMEAIGVPERDKRKVLSAIRSNTDSLANFGIVFNEEGPIKMFEYYGTEKINFLPALSPLKNKKT